jgi:hypothetical protein
MSRRALSATLVVVVFMLLAPSPVAAQADPPATIHLASDSSWTVYSLSPSTSSSMSLGAVQLVCLNAEVPPPCPSGATLYGSPAAPGVSWAADLSSIPGAHWIWAPGVTGDTSPAELKQFLFSKTFDLSAAPTSATLSVAVDDLAEVRVNSHTVGQTGSIGNVAVAGQAQNSLATFDIAAFLGVGSNTITVRGQNGPAEFSGACTDHCTYSQNPAGVVFGGTIDL